MRGAFDTEPLGCHTFERLAGPVGLNVHRVLGKREVRDARDGTGLSIVRALVSDELRGTLELTDDGGLRADVRFPA